MPLKLIHFLLIFLAGFSVSAFFSFADGDYEEFFFQIAVILIGLLYFFMPETIKAYSPQVFVILITLLIAYAVYKEVVTESNFAEIYKYNCEPGQKGEAGPGVFCECLCSGHAESQPEGGTYDYSNTVGCLGAVWVCKGTPIKKVTIIE